MNLGGFSFALSAIHVTENTILSYYAEFGTIGSLCPGEAETELTWAQPAYQTLKSGRPSQTYNVLGGSVQET